MAGREDDEQLIQWQIQHRNSTLTLIVPEGSNVSVQASTVKPSFSLSKLAGTATLLANRPELNAPIDFMSRLEGVARGKINTETSFIEASNDLPAGAAAQELLAHSTEDPDPPIMANAAGPSETGQPKQQANELDRSEELQGEFLASSESSSAEKQIVLHPGIAEGGDETHSLGSSSAEKQNDQAQGEGNIESPNHAATAKQRRQAKRAEKHASWAVLQEEEHIVRYFHQEDSGTTIEIPAQKVDSGYYHRFNEAGFKEVLGRH